MTKYFFHLSECGVVINDEEGREMPDFKSARQYAVAAAREIICAEVADGALCLGCHIEIENAGTGERQLVEFRDVVRITGE